MHGRLFFYREVNMKKSTLFAAIAAVFAVQAGNPLGLTEYQQSFTVDFKSEQEAQAAQIAPRKLPEKYTIAFTSRWDDSNKKHFNTHKVMSKYGAKGTFYLGGDMKYDNSFLRGLTENGCSLGSHTAHHHRIKFMYANTHFYEYMANRIAIEVGFQVPVNTQATPYGNSKGYKKSGTRSIGKSVMATGIIGSCDSTSPEHIKRWGFPENSCAFVYRISPGDRVPSMKKMESDLKKHLSNPDFDKNPALAMSVHSWHTPAGLVILDEIYKKLTSHKDWWNCNQNEYAAYRYEFLNTTVKKEVTGKSVKFTVLRFEPFELGADVPLYFDITNAQAVSATGVELADGGKQLKAAHSAGHALPEKYGYLKLDKVELKLSVSESDGKMTAEIVNRSGKDLCNVSYIFRKPPMYGKLVERVYGKSVANSAKVTIPAGKIVEKDEFFHVGKPYYAVQVDYILDGKRQRLYADCFGSERKTSGKHINEKMLFFQVGAKFPDGAKLSIHGASLAGLKPLTDIEYITIPGTIFAGKTFYFGVIDIESPADKSVKVALAIDKNSKMYLNGNEIKRGKSAVIELKKGRNRLAVVGNKGLQLFDPKESLQYAAPEVK